MVLEMFNMGFRRAKSGVISQRTGGWARWMVLMALAGGLSGGGSNGFSELRAEEPNQPPVIVSTSPAHGEAVGIPLVFDFIVVADDPDGEVISIQIQGAIFTSASAEWVAHPDGTVEARLSNRLIDVRGFYLFEVEITDDDGAVFAQNIIFAAGPEPIATMDNPMDGAEFVSPAVIPLSVSVVNAGETRRVDFLVNDEVIGTVTESPFTFDWEGVEAGAYVLTARVTDEIGIAGTSDPVGIVVRQRATVALTSPDADSFFEPGQSIPIRVDADPGDGAIVQVAYSANGTLLANVTDPPYSFNWSTTEPGLYQITAQVTDSLGGSMTTDPLPVVVDEPGDIPLAGLRLWLDAGVGVVADGDGRVATWRDRSFFGNDVAQSDLDRQPVREDSALNGEPVLFFPPEGAVLEADIDGSSLLRPDEGTVFVVQRQEGGSVINTSITWNAPDASNKMTLHLAHAQNLYFDHGDASAGGRIGDVEPAGWDNVYHVVEARRSPTGDGRIEVDGFTRVTGVFSDDLDIDLQGTLQIGALGSAELEGQIAEIILYNRALPEADRDQVRDYLGAKYGIDVSGNIDPEITLDGPADYSIYDDTQSVPISASVIDPEGPPAFVEFSAGSTVIGTVTTAPFQFDWTGAAVGEHEIRVRVVDAGGKSAEAGPIRVVINAHSEDVPTANLGLWLDAGDGVTADGEARVSAWNDRTAFGRALIQDEVELQPVRVPDVLNGLPVLRLDGADDLMTETAFGRGLFGENEATLFVVQKQNATSRSNTTLTWDAPNAANKVTLHFSFDDQLFFDFGNASEGGRVSGPQPPLWDDAFHLLEIHREGASARVFMDAVPVLLGDFEDELDVNRDGDLRLGAGGGGAFGGDIAEILIFNRALESADNAAVVDYLASKYALDVTGNLDPEVSWTAPATGSSFEEGQTIDLSVAASDPEAQIARVEFFDGAMLIGEVTAAPFELEWTGAAIGSHDVFAVVVDEGGKTDQSEAVQLVVNAGAEIPTAGLGLWLDAGTGVVVDGDGRVASWQDRTGFSRVLAQDDAELQPVRVAGELSGMPVVRFDGSDDWLGADAFGQGMFGPSSSTLFVVQRQNSSSTFNTTVTWNAPNSLNKVTLHFTFNDELLFDYGNASEGGRLSGPQPDLWDDTVHLIAASRSGATASVSMDNVNILTGTFEDDLDNTVSGELLVGGGGGGSFGGDVAEILVYSRTLTADETRQVTDFLGGKYGIDVSGNLDPEVEIVAPANQSAFEAGQTIEVVANASDPDGSIVRVEFLAGGVLLGEATQEPFRLEWENAEIGVHDLVARATDLGGKTVDSEPVRVLVNALAEIPASGLGLWLDAGSGVVADEEGRVSEWTGRTQFDRRLSQPDTELRPLRVDDGLNGMPVLLFDGQGDLLGMDTIGTGLFGEDAATIYVVQRQSSASRRNTTFTWNAPNSLNKVTLHFSFDDSLLFDYGNASEGGRLQADQPLFWDDTFHVLEAYRQEDGLAWVQMDGIEVFRDAFSDALSTEVTGQFLVGDGGGASYSGEIAEIIIYSRALSSSERASVQAYLGNKYNLDVSGNFDPSVTLTAPVPSSAHEVGDLIQLSADASDPEQDIVRVDFYFGETLIGSDLDGPYEMAWPDAPVGDHSVTARVIDGGGKEIVSESRRVLVMPGGDVPKRGLGLWLDASAGVETDGQGRAIRWTDRTLFSRALSAEEEVARPLVEAGAVNGLPALRFDGVGTILGARVGGQGLFESDGGTFFVVQKQERRSSANTTLTWNAPNSVNKVTLHFSFQDNLLFDFGDTSSGGRVQAVQPADWDDNWHVIQVSRAGTAASAIVDGFPVFTAEFGDELDIGVDGDLLVGGSGNALLEGHIAEILIYNRPLSDEEASEVTGYLGARYNLDVSGNLDPTIAWTGPADSASFDLGVPITLSADATDADQGVARVEFLAGDTLLDVDTDAPYAFVWSDAPIGVHAVSARVVDGGGKVISSAPVTLRVFPLDVVPLAGLGVWLDAGSGATIVDDGRVIAWVDRTESGHILVPASDAARPQLVEDVLNGEPVLRFDGADDRLDARLNGPGVFGSDAGTIYVVQRQTAASSFNTTVTWNAPNSLNKLTLHLTFGDELLFDYGSTGAGGRITGAQPDGWDDQWHVIEATRSGASGRLWVDGIDLVESEFTDDLNVDTEGDFLVGGSGSALFGGDIAEILIYSRALTDSERAQVQGYLGEKYGLFSPVNESPVVALTAPANGAQVNAGAPIRLVAAASDPDGRVVSVRFLADDVPVGTATSVPFEMDWTPSQIGTVSLTAVAVDNRGGESTSSPVSATVGGANNPPRLTWVLPAGPTLDTSAPTTVSLRVDAVDSDGTVQQVEFFVDGTLSATDASPPYETELSALLAGELTVTARAHDDSGVTGGSEPLVIRVLPGVEMPGLLVNRMSFTHYGEPGRVYTVEATSDFDEWVPVGTLESASGIAVFLDTDTAAEPRRFYRVRPLD